MLLEVWQLLELLGFPHQCIQDAFAFEFLKPREDSVAQHVVKANAFPVAAGAIGTDEHKAYAPTLSEYVYVPPTPTIPVLVKPEQGRSLNTAPLLLLAAVAAIALLFTIHLVVRKLVRGAQAYEALEHLRALPWAIAADEPDSLATDSTVSISDVSATAIAPLPEDEDSEYFTAGESEGGSSFTVDTPATDRSHLHEVDAVHLDISETPDVVRADDEENEQRTPVVTGLELSAEESLSWLWRYLAPTPNSSHAVVESIPQQGILARSVSLPIMASQLTRSTHESIFIDVMLGSFDYGVGMDYGNGIVAFDSGVIDYAAFASGADKRYAPGYDDSAFIEAENARADLANGTLVSVPYNGSDEGEPALDGSVSADFADLVAHNSFAVAPNVSVVLSTSMSSAFLAHVGLASTESGSSRENSSMAADDALLQAQTDPTNAALLDSSFLSGSVVSDGSSASIRALSASTSLVPTAQNELQSMSAVDGSPPVLGRSIGDSSAMDLEPVVGGPFTRGTPSTDIIGAGEDDSVEYRLITAMLNGGINSVAGSDEAAWLTAVKRARGPRGILIDGLEAALRGL